MQMIHYILKRIIIIIIFRRNERRNERFTQNSLSLASFAFNQLSNCMAHLRRNEQREKTNDRNGTNTRALPPAQRHSFRNLLFYLAEKCGSMISSRIRANSQNVRCQLMRIVELLN